MKTCLIAHPTLNNSIFHTQTTLVFRSFAQAGITVCFGDELLNVFPVAGDKLIVYGGLVGEALLNKMRAFRSQDRWLYVVDEQASGDDAPYAKTLSYMKNVLGTNNVIVTYQNAEHLRLLRDAGANVLVLPQCIETIRPRTLKTHDVLVSGQLDPAFFGMQGRSFYETRTRLAISLKREWPDRATLLQYPGTELSEAWHSRVGEGYLQTLDCFRMGIVCRGGEHDRFVGKYVEMGACHCLPVGDCPSYMPETMKQAMVNVEGMSDRQALDEMDRLLKNPLELETRTETFVREVEKRFLSLANVRRVLEEMRG